MQAPVYACWQKYLFFWIWHMTSHVDLYTDYMCMHSQLIYRISLYIYINKNTSYCMY